MINNLLCNTRVLVGSLQHFSQRSLSGIWEVVMSGFRLTSGICRRSSEPEVFAFWSQRSIASGLHSGFLGTADAWCKDCLVQIRKRRDRESRGAVRILEAVHQPSTMLSAEGTSGFFPPDNADMDMHKHCQRDTQGEEMEWKDSWKFMSCKRRDIYNTSILGAVQLKDKKN